MLDDNIILISQNCRSLTLTILLARLIILASKYSKVLTISKTSVGPFKLAAEAFTASTSFLSCIILGIKTLCHAS